MNYDDEDFTKYNIVNEKDDIIYQRAEEINKENPQEDTFLLAHALTNVMLRESGISLSANHIGFPYRMLVIASNPVLCMINPKIVWESEEIVSLEETCLTFPGLLVKVKRPKGIRVRYTQPNGNTETNKYTGMTARLIQHEIDNLNGMPFFKKANSVHLEQAKKKRNKKWKLKLTLKN